MAAYPIVLISLITSLIHSTKADPRMDIVARQCREGYANYSDNFVQEYEHIIGLMEKDMYSKKFSFQEGGDDPNSKMYVLAQCMEDLSSEDCKLCFSQISTLLPGCFPFPGGRVFLDGCFMRFDDYSFFNESVTVHDMKRCSTTIDDSTQHNYTVREVVTNLKHKATSNQGYAEDHFTLNGASVYGMANCWKTLNQDLCDSCLTNAVDEALKCLPSKEGRVLNSGCYFRYSDYEFTNNPKVRATQEAVLLYLSYAFGAIAICSLAIGIGFLVGKLAFRNRQNRQLKAIGLDTGKRSLQFKYSTLEKATEYFSAIHKLGQGAFGEVFKGTLPDGREIAIKRLFISGKFRAQEIYNEMDVISRAQHSNLVRFLGCCFTSEDSFLVYEYLVHRSLNCILFDSEKKKELDWKKRLGIVIGTAEGLKYLHEECQVRIVHRDIKASNILLDLKYKPKIADFGLARFYSCDNLISTAVAGTLGYMAPEYIAQGRLTEKVDVYSYGVLVLEIVSGVQTNQFHRSEESLDTLVTTAWKHFLSNTVSEIIDEVLGIEDIEEITRVAQVGLLCTQELPSLRPSMTTVIQMLRQKDTELPKPTKPPFTEESMVLSESLSLNRQKHSLLHDLDVTHHNDND